MELSGVEHDDAKAIAARLNAYREECGCSLGAKCLAAGVCIAITWLVAASDGFSLHLFVRLAAALVFAVVCSGAGKALGILAARRRLRREIDEVLATMAARTHHQGT